MNVSFVVAGSSSQTCVKSFLDYFASLFHFRSNLRAVNVYFTFPVLFYSILREHEKSRTRSIVLFGIFARQKYYCISSHSLFKFS